MHEKITQNKLSEEIKAKIYQGFGKQAIQETGINGLSEEPISFEIYTSSDFVGAIVVQPFWEQLHIKYLFVEEKFRGQGFARKLMQHALEYGRERGHHFAFVETMNFQAPAFYKKFGFVIEFSRSGYAKKTTFHYLKKSLNMAKESSQKIMRIGVYGVAEKNGKMLLIQQKQGPFMDRYDFPGGGMEFEESPEQALRREFVEEVSMGFEEMTLLSNLTATTEVPKESYTFYQIGLIYRIRGLHVLENVQTSELQAFWIDLKSLSESQCSALLWKYKQCL